MATSKNASSKKSDKVSQTNTLSKGVASASVTNKTKKSLTKVVVVETDSGEWVKPATGEKFYIDEEARFPEIAFEIKTEIEPPYKWSWEISWEAKVSGLREKARGKLVQTFKEQGNFDQSDKTWDAKKIGKVIGGKLVVKVIVDKQVFKRTVYILGKQPTQKQVDDYLVSKNAGSLSKLIKQESQHKHFILLDAEPIVSGDKGYGLAQLTIPPPSFEQIWNWKKHLDAAVELFEKKRKIAKQYLSQYPGITYTSEMLETESISRWNGGKYYIDNQDAKKWERNPRILCDTETGNIGWEITENELNKGKTEAELRKRDKDQYSKMKAGQTTEHPWQYSGVCYIDHLLKSN